VVAPAFGDVQVAGVFDGRDDGGADGGEVGRPLPVRLVAVSSPKVTSSRFSGGAKRTSVLLASAGPGFRQRLVRDRCCTTCRPCPDRLIAATRGRAQTPRWMRRARERFVLQCEVSCNVMRQLRTPGERTQ
jgi:hypothetical protein